MEGDGEFWKMMVFVVFVTICMFMPIIVGMIEGR